MTWHYAIRDRRLAEVFVGVPTTVVPPLDGDTCEVTNFGNQQDAEGYCLLGLRDLPYILRDIRWVVKGIRYDRHARSKGRADVA